jgi:hypothetical protein
VGDPLRATAHPPSAGAAKKFPITGASYMSKGQDRKKETKKKPAKTLDEKRAAKKAKKEGRGFTI